MKPQDEQNVDRFEYQWHTLGTMLGLLLMGIMVTAIIFSATAPTAGITTDYLPIISLDALAIVISYIIYMSGLRNHESDEEKLFFMILVAVNILYLYMDQICWLIADNPFWRTPNLITNTIYYLASILLAWMFWHYVGHWKGSRGKFYQKLSFLVNVVAVLSACIILANAKDGFIFTIGENGEYRRSGTYWISLVGPAILLLLSSALIIMRKLPLWDKVILLSYPIMPLIAAVEGIFIEGPTMLSVYVFISVVFNYSNLYVRRAEETSIIEGELVRSELNAMMLQINPHFIYNTLGSAASLCDIDPSAAQELIYQFSDYLRDNFTDIHRKPMVRFQDEMEHLNRYIAIEKVRFPNIEMEYEVYVKDFEIPSFTLQPLVENAIKHGICKRRRSAGTIWIQTLETETAYIVRVIDDGIGFNPMTARLSEGKHIGIKNVRTRLEILCRGTLEIEGEPGVGTTCEITIPKMV